MVLTFLSQKFTHDWQVNSVCCKSSLSEQENEFNDFQFYYFPSNLKKKKTTTKKKKNTQIKKLSVFKSFQYTNFETFAISGFSYLSLDSN